MTDHQPADRPGHLDIDAVSAFIDRDLEAFTLGGEVRFDPGSGRHVLIVEDFDVGAGGRDHASSIGVNAF